MKVKWLSKGEYNPAERLQDIINVYGKPTTIDKKSGGFAVWNQKTLKKKKKCYDRIVIRDEQIPHLKPLPHIDFLYLTIDYYIPLPKLLQVLGITQSLMYDQLKQQITVRCHWMKANINTLYLAIKIADGNLTLKEVKSKDLYKKLMTDPDENALKEREEYICKKVREFQKGQDKKLRGKRP